MSQEYEETFSEYVNRNWWQDGAQHGWQQSWQHSRQVDSQNSWQHDWDDEGQHVQSVQETRSDADHNSWNTQYQWQEDGCQQWEQPKEEQLHYVPPCAGRYNYDAPFSSEDWARVQEEAGQDLGKTPEEDLQPGPLDSRPYSYHAPSSSEHWAEDPYHWEKAVSPVEILDDDQPEGQVDEEAAKLHKQFMEYQEEQEEEVKHYRHYVETEDNATGSNEAGTSSKESYSNCQETSSVRGLKKHTEKEDFEFEVEKSGWFNRCTVLIALWQMNESCGQNARYHADACRSSKAENSCHAAEESYPKVW